MIIEFCGVPGGGKSTAVAAYLAANPAATLITLDMRRRLPEALFAALFALRHPLAFASLARFALRDPMEGLGAYSLHLAMRACAKYAKASWYSGGTELVIDEGLVHAAMTLAARPLEPAEASQILGRLVLPNRAMVARAGSFHRFHGERDVPHPRTLRGDEVLEEWEAAVRINVAQLAERLPALGTAVEDIPQKAV